MCYFLINMCTTMTYARQNVLKVLSFFVLLKKKTRKPTSCNIAGLRIGNYHTVKQQTYGGQFSQKERGLYCYLCRKHDTMNTQNKQGFSTRIQVRESIQRHLLITVKLYIKMLFPQKCYREYHFFKGKYLEERR